MLQDEITRVRKFNQSVAIEVGALEDRFLNRGRPLGPARVLHAIGSGHVNVSDLRSVLKLDTGLLSRMLRGLEAEGLIETKPSPKDRRSRITSLTAKGKAEFAIYETLSDERAASILARHKHSRRLLDAMDVVTVTLSRDDIVIEEADYASPIATLCLNAYAQELTQRLGFEVDLKKAGDPDLSQMKHPRGTFVVARLGDMPLGCVGIKGNTNAAPEVKRMWIAPAARGLGLARQMMTHAEQAALSLGITTLQLDTHTDLFEAVGLYRSMGWKEIEPFNDDPYPNLYFEKKL